jgi:hypothetical protein
VNALLGKFPPSWVSFSVSRKSGEKWYFELVNFFFSFAEKRFTLRRKLNRNRLFSLNDAVIYDPEIDSTKGSELN